MRSVLRSEVWWVDFDPSVGGEMQKIRPAVIVSNNAVNASLNRLQVVLLTSNVERVYSSEALVTLNGQPRKAMANQLTTASKLRFKTKLGVLSEPDIKLVEEAIKVQLALN